MELHSGTNKDAVLPLPWLEATIVVLGFFIAIFANAAFVFIILFRKSIRRPVNVPRLIIWFNLLVFPIQIWQQFFMRH